MGVHEDLELRLPRINFVGYVSVVFRWVASFRFNTEVKIDGENVVLATLCQSVGIDISKYANLSNRVCKSCGRKIRHLQKYFVELNAAINKNHLQFSLIANAGDPEEKIRVKRLSLTTISSPDRSPGIRKQMKSQENKVTERPKSSRNSLFITQTVTQSEQSIVEDRVIGKVIPDTKIEKEFSLLNIDVDVLNDSSRIEIKVLVVSSSGASLRTIEVRAVALIVKNLVFKRRKPVAIAIIKHTEIFEELKPAIGRKVSEEFKIYSKSDSVLKGTDPQQLQVFSNRLVLEEASTYLPIWNACIRGACGVNHSDKHHTNEKSINSMALATCVLARKRNPSMSALAYRISTILYHSGPSSQDTQHLHHLGICMSFPCIINLQKKMGVNSDAKVQMWKRNLEENRGSLKLMEEIKKNQLPDLQHSDMVLGRTVYMKQDTISETCMRFDKKLYNYIMNEMSEIQGNGSGCGDQLQEYV